MHVLDPSHLISTFGTLGILVVVFSESCFAFFLPGDSLLFTAGLLASQGRFGLNLGALVSTVTVAAILGNQIGYVAGRRLGPAIFKKPDSRFFKQEHLEKTHHYFERFGPKTIFLARFIPIVRTFACIVAGAGRMEYKVFLTYNVLGGVVWGAGVTIAGWLLGSSLPDDFNVDKYLLPMIVLIILISFIPVFVEYRKTRRSGPPSGVVNDVIRDEVTSD